MQRQLLKVVAWIENGSESLALIHPNGLEQDCNFLFRSSRHAQVAPLGFTASTTYPCRGAAAQNCTSNSSYRAPLPP